MIARITVVVTAASMRVPTVFVAMIVRIVVSVVMRHQSASV